MTQPTTATVLGALTRERLFDLSRIFGAGLHSSRQTKAQVAQLLALVLGDARVDVKGVPPDTTTGRGVGDLIAEGSNPPTVKATDERRSTASGEPAASGLEMGPAPQKSGPSESGETVSPRHRPAVGPTKPPLAWADVERVVQAAAAKLRPCSPERYMVLGLRIYHGRAQLESLDASPVERVRDKCVLDVVRVLKFRNGGPVTGTVGVKLTG